MTRDEKDPAAPGLIHFKRSEKLYQTAVARARVNRLEERLEKLQAELEAARAQLTALLKILAEE